MSLVKSRMLELGTPLPHFRLPNTVDGKWVENGRYRNQPLLVAFICNHCPYVIHLAGAFSTVLHQITQLNIGIICISSNDIATHPADAPDKMTEFAQAHGFNFPYCYDENQQTARDFQAECTPDWFLFDSDHRLFYRGRFDGSTPGNGVTVTGEDLLNAAAKLTAGHPAPQPQHPSMGCNIKWKT